MPRTVNVIDRLRIERAVWALDQRLYDLPTKSRVAKRREVRDNLLTAAQDIGAGAALSRLGNSRELAAEYLSAEFGDEPRPMWYAAGFFLLTGQLIFTSVLSDAAFAFRDGILAVNPHATGTFSWHGIPLLQSRVTYTFLGGKATSVGGAWTPLAWVLWLLATVLIGRLWRAVPQWRRRRAARDAAGG